RDCRDVAARQRGALMAARPHRGISARGCRAGRYRSHRRRFRRGALDRARGDRAGCSGACSVAGADHALREPGQGRLHGSAASDDAQQLRWPQDRAHGRAERQNKINEISEIVIVVIMGVCGCGKTTVGQALANRLGWPFFDADDFHPPANVAKMAKGVALTDEDRGPWLDLLAAEMRAVARKGNHAVRACSALKESYRRRIAQGLENARTEGESGSEVRIVY